MSIILFNIYSLQETEATPASPGGTLGSAPRRPARRVTPNQPVIVYNPVLNHSLAEPK
jgi:hypothetical protein